MTYLQSRVNYYFTEQDIFPLKFSSETEKEKEIRSSFPLDKLIWEILMLSRYNRSINTNTNSTQCYENKWRSSGDIWRHVIYYKPNVTIFEVMESLYETKEKYVGHYCCTVRKRVFKLRENAPGFYLMHQEQDDEYGLTFYDWKNITEE